MKRAGTLPRAASLLFPVIVLALALGFFQSAGPARSGGLTFTVDRTDDPNPVADDCDPNVANDCSLRGAIATALNISGPDDDIILPDLGAPGSDTFRLNGQISIPDSSLDITGAGRDITLIDGGLNGRVFAIGNFSVVTISDLTVKNGRDFDLGGGVKNSGFLTLDNVAIGRNYTSNFGAGIHNTGTLTIRNSLIESNLASEFESSDPRGGGIYNLGTLTITDSAFTSNGLSSDSYADGGAIYNDGSGSVDVIRTTVDNNGGHHGGAFFNNGASFDVFQSAITNNAASAGAGAMHTNVGTVRIINAAISGNNDNTVDGAIHLQGGTAALTNSTIYLNGREELDASGGSITLRNTIIVGSNQEGDDDCDGNINSLGNNIDSDGTCNLDQLSDQPSADPRLGPLQDNGGPTLTHALRPGSPAVDAGDDTACADALTVNSRDQRGITRPQGAHCDIGAFESRFCNGQPETIAGDNAANILNGTPGTDVILGLGGADTIDGNQGNDTICAGSGEDSIDGGPGPDYVDGGSDTDTATFPGNTARTISLITGQVSGETPGRDLKLVENIKGSNAGDTMTGSGAANKLEGNSGSDTLKGGDGADDLRGGSGIDTIGGQGGSGDKCHGGGPELDKFFGGSKTASGCETVVNIP